MELATKRSPMDGDNVGARGFPLSAEVCNPPPAPSGLIQAAQSACC
jgi:hypothetical protein